MKTFYAIIANALVSVIASTLVWFSLTIWVYLQTKSVVITSILSSGFLIGMLLTGLYFGSIVDHHQKKAVMIISDIVSLLFFVAGFFIYASTPIANFTDPGSYALWGFLTIIFCGVITANLRAIALPTLPSFLVPEDRRDRANGLIGTMNGVSFLVSPMLGGVLIALSGMYHILLGAIILRLLTISHLLFVPINEGEPEEHLQGQKRTVDIKGTFKVIMAVPGLLALMVFNSINNFLGGVFMPLVDPYGLSLVSQQVWGFVSGALSIGFIISGLFIAKFGLGKNPVKTLFVANIYLWIFTIFFTIQPSFILLVLGMFLYFFGIPLIESSEQTIIQKVVPKQRQGRVFGFAQSVEQMASPISSLIIGPLTQFVFIPYMTTGNGAKTIGWWFGVGESRGIALAFTVTGIVGLIATIYAMRSVHYKNLVAQYQKSHRKIR